MSASAGAALPRQGEVLWTAQAQMPAGEAGPLPAQVDAAIVGGGYTGLSAAAELAAAGRSVVVLEQGPFGFGASGRNAGFAHAGVRRSLPELRRRFGDALGGELYAETVRALDHVAEVVERERIDCGHAQRGYLYLAERPRQAQRLQRTRAALATAGHDARLLDRDAVAAHAGSDRYAAGLLLEGAAAVQPARFAAGLARVARDAGARLHDGTRVDALVPRAGGGVDVVTAVGTVRAGQVLLATDGYTGRLLPSLTRRIIPIDSFMVATEPLAPELRAQVSPHGHLCLETKNFLCYWRLDDDGRLVFGGRASFSPTSVERAAEWLETRMRRAFPQLEGVGIEAAWGGKTGFSFDQLPHLGREGDITYAVTYCGGGVALAAWFGRRAAGWMLGKEPPPFARIPFPQVPLYRGRPWFLPLVGPAFALQDRWG